MSFQIIYNDSINKMKMKTTFHKFTVLPKIKWLTKTTSQKYAVFLKIKC